MISNIWRPEAFHGAGKASRYFEGWYFKAVSRDEEAAYAIIPGISLAEDPAQSHAFVLLLDARGHRLYYAREPPGLFLAQASPFELSVGGNSFSLRHIRLDAADGSSRFRAEVRLGAPAPWPVKAWSPGAMGWYAFVPGMECYHGILSFSSPLEGYIEVDGRRVSLDGGRGYIEKDWGRSMPSSWIWLQTNHFGQENVSLSGSVARVPWFGRSFAGFIFGLYLDGRLFRFATYTGAKIKGIEAGDGSIDLRLEDRKYKLSLSAARADGVSLPAPSLGSMSYRVKESLRSSVAVKLYRKRPSGDELLFEGTGRNAGLEVVGDPAELLSGLKR